MDSILLTWNPGKWNGWSPDYDTYAAQVRDNGPQEVDWSIGNRTTGIGQGVEAWLFLQGGIDPTRRGILGHATVKSAPWRGTDPKDSSRTTNRIDITWDLLLPESDLIDVVTLESAAPRTAWRGIRNSGARINPADIPAIRQLWTAAIPSTPFDDEAPGTYPEGSTRTVLVNKYERSRAAREACIAKHGSKCKACGLDFQQMYGDIGDGYIQVHHTVPVSQIGSNYQVDPVKDLVPLCANCHVMAHRRRPDPYTVGELRRRLRRSQ
ncbi:5-methylcytosine-specific restriction protein A [Williamsia muralis]|uniref:5-methylcytosine-specific restriction protein A n=1 Tax=Williamsia marianensis TaxID=85044 RepID=A0A495K4M8_WILMA|nr:HNH endonuclease [Williamsia muralis]RKR96226.1 5-methylcytosine-specific restriction protein A [Williamsia muralis]